MSISCLRFSKYYKLCVFFYRHHFDIVCAQTGQITKLHEIETTKRSQTQLVAALDLCDGQETELLLCYNRKRIHWLFFLVLIIFFQKSTFSFSSLDTCHFHKLNEENKTTEFDFHWNTSPTSVVCAFPYIIAFTSDSMEIRLLVNGNLVHTVTMADLELITSKRDIYFATTAPEFIPKDFRIKGIENEQDSDHQNDCGGAKSKPQKINQFSNERILEIKHKIDGQLPSSSTSSTPEDFATTSLHINHEDNLNKLLPLPFTSCHNDNSPCIQRARSLQKPKNSIDEQRRHISKSNSCGDSYAASKQSSEFSPSKQPSLNSPVVPPNSPKSNATDSPISPTKKFYQKSISSNYHHSRSQFYTNSSCNENNSPEKVKPLRIFRIPLCNLTGSHSHYHTHNSVPTKPTKLQAHKIDEDHLESDDEVAGDNTTILLEDMDSKKCDRTDLNTKFNNVLGNWHSSSSSSTSTPPKNTNNPCSSSSSGSMSGGQYLYSSL